MLHATMLASLLVGPGAVVLAAPVLKFPEAILRRLTPRVLSFAVGSLLGMALLRMLPRALAHADPVPVLRTALWAMLGLFLLERFRILRHCHEFHCQEHADLPPRIFMGNGAHALVDGIALTLAFQAGTMAGWVFALALLGHEVPKALVSLVLLKEGREEGAAFLWNLVPSLFTPAGALMAHAALAIARPLAPHALAAGAAFFLYLSLADLVPRHRLTTTRSDSAWQAALVLAGVLLIHLLPAHS